MPPPAEVHIDEDLARRLLEDQHPDLAHLPLRPLDEGWDNVMFRLGDELTMRIPRRAISAPFAEQEQRWLPELAPALPLPIPAPVRTGGPGAGYPWAWSICPWLPGARMLDAPPDDERDAAVAVAGFLNALHQPAPADAPYNPFRGLALADRDAATRDRVERLGTKIDAAAVTALWEEAAAVPRWNGAPVWVHGDIHGGNVLVHEGRVSAVIDFGDLGASDPAPDLAAAWMLFGPEARKVFRDHVDPVDDDTWARARGWALNLGLMFLSDAGDLPPFVAMGRHTLGAVLDDAD